MEHRRGRRIPTLGVGKLAAVRGRGVGVGQARYWRQLMNKKRRPVGDAKKPRTVCWKKRPLCTGNTGQCPTAI